MPRERSCQIVALLMSVSCPGHLLLSRLNSWNDDDIDLCRSSRLPLGSTVRKSMFKPCKSSVIKGNKSWTENGVRSSFCVSACSLKM